MELSTRLPLAFAAGVALLLAAALYGIAVAQSRHRQAVTQMDEVTQQNAALGNQASAAAQSLQSQAGNLVQAVSLFRLSQGTLGRPRRLPGSVTTFQCSCTSMGPTQIKVTGLHGSPFKLGGPMLVFEGKTLLETLDPVDVLKDGTEIHIEAFIPTQVVLNERRHVGRFLFFEICAYITEYFPQIQAISFAFVRPIDALGRPAEQAVSRTSAMERIGAVNITVTPVTLGVHVVSGVWPYSEANRVALLTALEEQRAIYRDKPIVRSSLARRFFAKLAVFSSRSARSSK